MALTGLAAFIAMYELLKTFNVQLATKDYAAKDR